jgi:hypothetical protein
MAARRVAPPHAHARAPPSACGPSSQKCRPECASWNCKLSGRGKTPQQGDTLSRSVVRITGDGHVDGAGARVTRMSLPSARTSARRPAQQPDGERPCASRARPCLSESRYRSGARRAEMTAPSCRPTRRALARRLRARVGRGALRRPGCRGHVLVERYFPLAIPSRASLGPRASASCAAMSATPRGTCARHVGSGSAPSCSTMRVTRTAPAPGRATMTELVGHLRRSPEGVGEGLQASKPRRLPALEEQRTTATRTRHHRGNRRARRPRLRARRGESDDRATGLDPQRLRPEGPAPAA